MKINFIIILFLCLVLSRSTVVHGQEITEEKVFVHLNKTLAIAGETLWFTLYLNNSNQEPYSKIAYAEIIDRDGNPVHQTLFSVEKGLLHGYVEIPNQLISDHYLIRFYTRISPLLHADGVDSQLITIINPQKPNRVTTSVTDKTVDPGIKAHHVEHLIEEATVSVNSPLQLNLGDFEGKNIQISSSLENKFLTEDFRGRWNRNIYQSNPENPKWIPEPFGHVVYGKNLDVAVDTTATFFLSAHGTQSVLNTAKSQFNGDLFFDLGPLKSYDYFIIQSSNPEKQLNFSIQSPFMELKFKDEFEFPDFQLNENDKDLLLDLILASQVSPYFYSPEQAEFSPIVTGFVADKTYLLDDYNRFDRVETVLREYVPEVAVRKQNKKTLFKLLNNPIGAIFDQNPLLLIDAMPVFDTDVLAGFSPEKIRKLEVLAREFYLNEDKFAGVLSFSTFENNFGGFPLPETALYLNYPQIQAPKFLQSAHFNAQVSQSNFPDFRTSLYWDNIEDVKETYHQVYTSKISGDFELKVSYLNDKGEFIIVKDVFQIID